MTRVFQEIAEWRDVSFALFRSEIYPLNRPAVLRGLAKDWPAVGEGAKSPQAFGDYIGKFDRGQAVNVLTAPPQLHGRFFYDENMQGYNFERRKEPVSMVMAWLLAHLDDADPPAYYLESAPLADCLPDFPSENRLEFFDASVLPRIWMGNRVRTQTHYDLSDNIACVVAGRRRFTLFGPDQIANLYMGPLEFTPSGTPISMASMEEPDPVRFPRFEKALETGQSAELGPGDAIFIPYFWWHHVQSLEPFNVLVNYWWNDAVRGMGSIYDCLLHAVLAIRDLPAGQRMAWRPVFDYFVFKTSGEPMAHLPPHARGALGAMTPEQQEHMKKVLLHSLERAVAEK